MATADSATALDPRVERSRRLICDAALDELAEVGYGAMNIESIAKRAGVGKATIYRHWTGKLDLIESALELIKPEMPVPENGPIRDQLIAILAGLASFLADSSSSTGACLPAMISASQYDESVRQFHHRYSAQRRAVIIEVLDGGKASGEIDIDVDTALLTEMLVGPLFYRRMMTPTPFASADVHEVVDMALAAAAPR